MKRVFAVAFALAGVLGCAQLSAPDMDAMMTKPAPPEQLKRLSGLIGEWSGEGHVVSPAPDEPVTMKGTQSSHWALDGMAMRSEGTYEMPGGEKANFTEVVMWNKAKNKFQSLFFSDWGEMGVGWWDVSDDGKRIRVQAEGTRPDGSTMSGSGDMRFIDADTIEWEWSEAGMQMKGTTRRTK